MRAEIAHAIIALKKSGCEHPIIERLFQYPLSQRLDRDEDFTVKDLCDRYEIRIATPFRPSLEDLAR